MDVGGDWYDVIGAGVDNGFLFVVGDVSGRGIEAATTMACLHYAIRAYAAQGDAPTVILTKLSGLLHVSSGRPVRHRPLRGRRRRTGARSLSPTPVTCPLYS